MLTNEVKNVFIKANKQKYINGLFGTKSISKIFYMSHQKNILWTYDINGKNIIWLHKGLCIQKRIEEARALRKEEKIVLQRKNVLGNILVKLQMDKDGVILSHPFTTQHSCITTSCGLSQKARKKRMFYRTFFTWNNTFFATLAHQATKQEHMGCFGTYKQQLYVYVHFKWASRNQPL